MAVKWEKTEVCYGLQRSELMVAAQSVIVRTLLVCPSLFLFGPHELPYQRPLCVLPLRFLGWPAAYCEWPSHLAINAVPRPGLPCDILSPFETVHLISNYSLFFSPLATLADK